MKTKQEIEKECYCKCYTVKEYKEDVEFKYLTAYDGFGLYHNGEKETNLETSFNVKDIEKYKNKYPYVCWHNRLRGK